MKRHSALLLAVFLLLSTSCLATGCAARIEPVSSRTVQDDLSGEPDEPERSGALAGPEAPVKSEVSFGRPQKKTEDSEETSAQPDMQSQPQAKEETPEQSAPQEEPSSQEQAEVHAELYTEQGQYPVDVDSIRVFILNNGSAELGYDAYYSLERQNGESFEEIEATLSFEDWAGILPPGKETSVPTDLAPFAGKLTPGRYRIVKKLDGQIFYAPFELV